MYTYVYTYIYIYNMYMHIIVIYMLNGPDGSVVRAYGLGGGRSWVRSSPCRTEWVTGQSVQSRWRISSSTSGANTSCEGKESSSLKNKHKILYIVIRMLFITISNLHCSILFVIYYIILKYTAINMFIINVFVYHYCYHRYYYHY